jgi:hypothetical protein
MLGDKKRMVIDELEQPNPGRPKSGFAREKAKRLAAEKRADKAEAALRELGVMDDEIETQEPEQSAPLSPDRPRSGYARLRNRHRDLIGMHERLQEDYAHLKRDHEQLEKSFSELLALHDGLLSDLRARKSHPLTAALAGHVEIGGRHV